MSTGADCIFVEKKPGQWFYELQRYPYGASDDYETNGPFPTFRAAEEHLHENHANPGGYSRSALPGCKHDLARELGGRGDTHVCDRCGEFLDLRTPEQREAAARERRWQQDEIQFPRLLAEIEAVGLTPKQYAQLGKSMDLPKERIDELFNRAQKEWERVKARRL